MRSYIISLFVILSIATAAKEKPKEFTVGSFFEGSWIIAKRDINLDNGNIIGEAEFSQYNVTKTNDNEYDIFPLEANSYHRQQDAEQVVMITSSNLDCEIQKYDANTDQFASFAELKFIPMLPAESFMATKLYKGDSELEYEITTLGANHFTIKLTPVDSKIATVYSATRVIIPPPMTFMQKYGMSIVMGVMIIIQMGLKLFLAGPMPTEKPKTD